MSDRKSSGNAADVPARVLELSKAIIPALIASGRYEMLLDKLGEDFVREDGAVYDDPREARHAVAIEANAIARYVVEDLDANPAA